MKKPETERELALYRAELNCKIAKDALDGKNKEFVNTQDQLAFAMYNILSVLEEIAFALCAEGQSR